MMSQIGSGGAAESPWAWGGWSPRVKIFMSAMLAYFSFFVTQIRPLTKGSYRSIGLERSALNRSGGRALVVRAQHIGTWDLTQKRHQAAIRGKPRLLPRRRLPWLCHSTNART